MQVAQYFPPEKYLEMTAHAICFKQVDSLRIDSLNEVVLNVLATHSTARFVSVSFHSSVHDPVSDDFNPEELQGCNCNICHFYFKIGFKFE